MLPPSQLPPICAFSYSSLHVFICPEFNSVISNPALQSIKNLLNFTHILYSICNPALCVMQTWAKKYKLDWIATVADRSRTSVAGFLN